MSRALLVAALLVPACSSSNGIEVDAGGDFAIGPQVTHVGPNATTCCMVTNGAGQVLYLVNPAPSMPDAQGRDLPANGELHLSNPFGVDITLGAGVPAFGYAFSPDQRWALFLTKTKTFHYALNLAPLEGPELHAPTNVVAIADGLQNAALFPAGVLHAERTLPHHRRPAQERRGVGRSACRRDGLGH